MLPTGCIDFVFEVNTGLFQYTGFDSIFSRWVSHAKLKMFFLSRHLISQTLLGLVVVIGILFVFVTSFSGPVGSDGFTTGDTCNSRHAHSSGSHI